MKQSKVTSVLFGANSNMLQWQRPFLPGHHERDAVWDTVSALETTGTAVTMSSNQTLFVQETDGTKEVKMNTFWRCCLCPPQCFLLSGMTRRAAGVAHVQVKFRVAKVPTAN